ncbi:peptide chain release factor N(5)-glutamine methyltransferase [Litorivicinus sp.]|nr:peptide chain release factor N(5)-glutamine methyltransferase [Litorivicinus sp.]
MTLGELLRTPAIQSAGWTGSELDVVCETLLDLSRIQRVMGCQIQLSDDSLDAIFSVANRSANGVPLAYILGFTYFDGFKISVTPDVLIPRPDTEILISVALRRLDRGQQSSILDLCTGSGAVALALKSRSPQWQMTGSDISSQALDVAKINALQLGLNVDFICADLFDGLGLFDLIVTNPPYIAAGDIRVDASVARYEPAIALYAGEDGLDLIRRIIEAGQSHCRPGGYLCIEHGPEQASTISAAARDNQWWTIETTLDLAGRERVTCMRAPL